jgi:hypothetical protein
MPDCECNERYEMVDKIAELSNIVLRYSIHHDMPYKEVERCIEKVKDIYLSDGLIRK